MKNKFWELYRKNINLEIIVGLWFITPMVTLFLTNDGGLALVMTIIVAVVTTCLENGYNNYIRSK